MNIRKKEKIIVHRSYNCLCTKSKRIKIILIHKFSKVPRFKINIYVNYTPKH